MMSLYYEKLNYITYWSTNTGIIMLYISKKNYNGEVLLSYTDKINYSLHKNDKNEIMKNDI